MTNEQRAADDFQPLIGVNANPGSFPDPAGRLARQIERAESLSRATGIEFRGGGDAGGFYGEIPGLDPAQFYVEIGRGYETDPEPAGWVTVYGTVNPDNEINLRTAFQRAVPFDPVANPQLVSAVRSAVESVRAAAG